MKISLLILAYVIIFVLTSLAQNVFILPEVCGFGSDIVLISADIENADPFVGFQFDLPLPAQTAYIENSASLSGRANGHSLNASLLPGDTLRVLSYSMNLSYFQGNSGPVIEFLLLLGDVPGIYPLELENAIIANENSQNILTSIENGNLILIGPVAPDDFNLLSPDSGALVETITPTLNWEDAPDLDPIDSLVYTLYWSLDSTWSSVDSVAGLTNSEYSFTQSNPVFNNAAIWWKVKAIDNYQLATWSNQIWMFITSSTSIGEKNCEVESPSNFKLWQNYPNPFNSSTSIVYYLPCLTDFELTVYDIQGKLIKQWKSISHPPGIYQIVWNSSDQGNIEVAGGIYFCRLLVGDYIETRKMVLLR